METYSVRFSLEIVVEAESDNKAITVAEAMILQGDFSIIDINYMDIDILGNEWR